MWHHAAPKAGQNPATLGRESIKGKQECNAFEVEQGPQKVLVIFRSQDPFIQ